METIADNNENDEDGAAERQKVAEIFLSQHLAGQQEWYSKKASKFKSWSQFLAMAVIVGGGLTALLQVFQDQPWLPVTTAVVGLLILVSRGAEKVWRFEETWYSYRRASEGMKREKRLFINAAGPYKPPLQQDEAYRLFVERVEAIIAEEQSNFWKDGSND